LSEEKARERRLKWAAFPYYKTLDKFQLDEQPSLTKRQFHQLRKLAWLDQLYNLILLGPPGVRKTHLAIRLGTEAIHLNGGSYRMKHRISIFSDETVQN